jgi:hypothetical protein
MVDPDDPDREKADQVGDVVVPVVGQVLGEVAGRVDLRISRISSVIAIANTPSLNASIRSVVTRRR